MRSSKPGSDEIAAACGTVSLPLFSPAMLTGKKLGGQLVVCNDSSPRACDVESGGTHIGSIPAMILFDTLIHPVTALAKTYQFNDDPPRPRLRMPPFCWHRSNCQWFRR